MTIAMLVCDPPHVLVAADRRYTVRNPEDPSYLFHSEVLYGQPYVKVRVHPTLPVVYVTAGLASFDGSMAKLVADLCNPRTFDAAYAALWPLVQRSTNQRLDVLIGGLGAATHVHFHAKGAEVSGITQGCIVPSAHTEAFINSLPWSEKLPPRRSNPSKIAKHMRRLLGRAIAVAQQAHGDEADVGGYIDVALAGPNGAQIFK